MAAWIILWKAVFILGMSVFVVMAAGVTVQGFRDIRSLLETISRSHHRASRRPGVLRRRRWYRKP